MLWNTTPGIEKVRPPADFDPFIVRDKKPVPAGIEVLKWLLPPDKR